MADRKDARATRRGAKPAPQNVVQATGQLRHYSGKRPHPWRWVALIGFVMVVAIAVPGYLFAKDALAAKDATDRLKAQIEPAKAAAKNRDSAAIQTVLANVSADAVDYADHTQGPLWDLAAKVPWVKDQVIPLMALGDTLTALNDSVLVPLEQQDLSIIESPPIDNGRIDPYIAEPFVPILAEAQTVIEDQNAKLAQVDTSNSIAQIADGVATVRDALAGVPATLQTVNEILPMVPQLLGAGTTRTYEVIIQNNSEPRATGGIPGSAIDVTVADGQITIGDFYSAADFGIPFHNVPLGQPTDEELALFGSTFTSVPQDSTYTPEFPRSAALMADYWERLVGAQPSAVISLDPVALQYILKDAQPVTVGDLTVDGTNLASALLGDFYLKFPDPDVQDQVFAQFAKGLISQAMQGNIAFDGAAHAIEEGRIFAWSPDSAEEAAFTTLGIDGAFLENSDAIGIFQNDTAGSKIGYYVNTTTTVAATQCAAGRPQQYDVTYSVSLDFDGDMSALPTYVSGGYYDTPLGRFSSFILLIPPSGGTISSVDIDGTPVDFTAQPYEGRQVVKVRVEIGQHETAAVHFVIDGDFDPATSVVVSPTARTNFLSDWVSTAAMNCAA
ncbi:DUF4012 domain-containing protein [Demequina capsici]|uniref:DUF4012 domain-containing protein n=1 Tax=Demequina capsici TaxID=3075620 RepID=A0AA96FG22_9MICO|nr:DUF4012 domain-containing protein [Demequina sp. PMTSA13]WNM27800.1 DUF4012 domain-containing protein [Demequina sp. PMTSA13]